MLNTMKILMKKILNFKLVIMSGFQNKKHFVKGYTRNWSGEVFVVNKIKNTVPWRYAISNLNGEPILEFFMNKNCKKLFKKNLE